MAVAPSILIIASRILSCCQPYQDLASDYFDVRERAAIARRTLRRLEQLGFQVTLHASEEVT